MAQQTLGQGRESLAAFGGRGPSRGTAQLNVPSVGEYDAASSGSKGPGGSIREVSQHPSGKD